MPNADDMNPLFQSAVAAIDSGDVMALERLLVAHPRLVHDRLEAPGEWLRGQVGKAVDPGEFFERPYLLWFVAEDPVRNGRLPANIADIAACIIRFARAQSVANLKEQLDYALRLTAWSRVARDSNAQIALIEVLMEAGAMPWEAVIDDAIVNGHLDAAAHLAKRGARLTLAGAACLGLWDDFARLAPLAGGNEKQDALVLAALNGRYEAARRLLTLGIDPSAHSNSVYSHASPLHHAVGSGSIDTVKTLVENGANLRATDLAWNGTPLNWAEYYIQESKSDDVARSYRAIAEYLRSRDTTAA